MHGSVGAGALRYVATGAPAALCVMHVDGWVYAHTLFDSSANYRSAVVHGELRALSGDEAAEALTQISECLTPGRSAEVPFHTEKQLAATTALAMDIVEGQWTVKIRDAGPGEPEPGEATQGLWTGILPIVSAYGHDDTLGDSDLYVSRRCGGTWRPLVHLPAPVNSPAREYSPRITPDGRTLLYASERGLPTEPRPEGRTYAELVRRIRSIENGLGNIYAVPLDAALAGVAPCGADPTPR